MAGGHGGYDPIHRDPGLEAWTRMKNSVYTTFKFTPRTTKLTLFWGIFVPCLTYSMAVTNANVYDWAGKRRDEGLLRIPAPSAPAKDGEEEE
ncbi:uncharacterized protein L969DRAFT_102346 [Mixia osmundae IAM 14324]|uniref:Complex I-B15 n=1 Tax=Mixia osmundae (strain CBS 9802 / IAM 14324 / JCM 22182 / KY 12970) TaxID=764103 RepID=G7EAR9_MIXOS|nr:uncharacterized protein L969DRAFT_102346 [Mixia osmundae IAM 14324]KEI40898.1 hypothetical protein L969DRAFT_102346 [Mixia osmundae IAM 14324]GAA99929.1 hypothetical protein E5Q_06632 [Mixia osmundae IAM 14324]